MTRKIIQIAVAAAQDQMDTILALCDDGSVWFYRHSSDEWKRLPNVPQQNARTAAS